MLTVYKYEIGLRHLNDDSTTVVRMPKGSELLHAACQYEGVPDVVAVWARVDTDAPLIGRRIGVFGTGHSISPDFAWRPVSDEVNSVRVRAAHVGSCVTHGGRLVWHVFDGGEEE